MEVELNGQRRRFAARATAYLTAAVVGALIGWGQTSFASGASVGGCSETGDTCMTLSAAGGMLTFSSVYPDRLDSSTNLCITSPTGRRCWTRPPRHMANGGTEWSVVIPSPSRGFWWVGDLGEPFGLWVGNVNRRVPAPRIAGSRGGLAGPGTVLYTTSTICNRAAGGRTFFVHLTAYRAGRQASSQGMQLVRLVPRACRTIRVELPEWLEKSYSTSTSSYVVRVLDTSTGRTAAVTRRLQTRSDGRPGLFYNGAQVVTPRVIDSRKLIDASGNAPFTGGYYRAQNLSWRNWGASTARASGLITYCPAGGGCVTRPGRVDLSAPGVDGCGEGLYVYRRLRFIMPGSSSPVTAPQDGDCR